MIESVVERVSKSLMVVVVVEKFKLPSSEFGRTQIVQMRANSSLQSRPAAPAATAAADREIK